MILCTLYCMPWGFDMGHSICMLVRSVCKGGGT